MLRFLLSGPGEAYNYIYNRNYPVLFVQSGTIKNMTFYGQNDANILGALAYPHIIESVKILNKKEERIV